MNENHKSFYGHKIIKKDIYKSVFLLKKNSYILAFIYIIDEEQFEKEYQKEGVFFRNVQMPRIFSYKKINPYEDLEMASQPEENNTQIKDLKEHKVPKKTIGKKTKKKKYPWFTLAFTQILANGDKKEIYKTKCGKTTYVLKNASGGISSNFGR